MCYFVFVGVRARQRSAFVRRLSDAGCQVMSTANASVQAAFPEGDAVSVVVHNGCSCDLYAERRAAFDEDAQRAKYRKKKWSPAKIERAIVGKRPRERPSFAAFRDAFAAVVRDAGGARILAHSFSGNVETEAVEVTGTASLSLDEYLDAGGAYVADVVHHVRAG